MRFIYAVDEKGGIGISGKIPWRFKEDFEHFKRNTTYSTTGMVNIVLMGAKTWTSLPGVLPGRKNVVISKSLSHSGENKVPKEVEVFPSLEAFSKWYREVRKSYSKLFCIGGGVLFNSVLGSSLFKVANVIVTRIPGDYSCDAHFTLPLERFKLKSRNILESKDLSRSSHSAHSQPSEASSPSELQEKKVTLTFEHYKRSKNFCEQLIHGAQKEWKEENQYLLLVHRILDHGSFRDTRNGKTKGIFHFGFHFDLRRSFPLLTNRRIWFRAIFEEHQMFMRGQTNTKVLEEKGIGIWKGNTCEEFLKKKGLPYKEGDMGPSYSFQFKHFGAEYKDCETDYKGKGYDQVEYCLDKLLKSPQDRDIMMTSFDPTKLKQSVGPPCHSIVVQYYVAIEKEDSSTVRSVATKSEGKEGETTEKKEKRYLSIQMYQRSCDVLLGCPFNIASMALQCHLFCAVLNARCGPGIEYLPDRLYITLGDAHIYESHFESARTIVGRAPLPFPQLEVLARKSKVEDFNIEDVKLVGYQHHPAMDIPMVA